MEKYAIDFSSPYSESCKICGVPVYIFKDHNMALPAWGSICNRIQSPVNLITFDYHTDTHFSFNNYIIEETTEPPRHGKHGLKNPIVRSILENKHYRYDDFSFEDVFCLSISCLENTEQILCGVDFGYLLSFIVINRTDDVAIEYEQQDRTAGYNSTYSSREQWGNWDSIRVKTPFILDFDLDFFGKESDFDAEFIAIVSPLIKKAVAITVAREPKYFEECKQDKNYTNDKALSQLLSLIRSVLGE